MQMGVFVSASQLLRDQKRCCGVSREEGWALELAFALAS